MADQMNYHIHCDYHPQVVEIEMTRICNINPPCPFCARARVGSHHLNVELPNDFFVKYKEIFDNAKSIFICGWGEPFASPNLERIFKMFSHVPTSFLSNGQLMGPDQIDLVLSSNIGYIGFSIDAARPDTYYKLRGSSMQHLNEVLGNIRSLVDEKKKRGKNFGISMKFIVMKINCQEMVEFVGLAASVGVSQVVFTRLGSSNNFSVSRGDLSFTFEDQVLEIPDDLKQLCIKRAEETNIDVKFR